MHIHCETGTLNFNQYSNKHKSPPIFKNKIVQTNTTPKAKKSKQKKVIISSSNISHKNSNKNEGDSVIQFQTGQKQRNQNVYMKSKDQKITKVKSTYEKMIPSCSSIKNIYTNDTKTYEKQNSSHILHQTIKELERKVKKLQKQIQLKDKKIGELESASKQYVKSTYFSNCQNHANSQFQNQNYKIDLQRLLRMLQLTEQYKSFAAIALQDRSVKFLQHVSKTVKTKIDLQKQKKPVHYCMCHKQYIAQSGLWVPQTIYSFGKLFIKDCKETITKSEYQLLLYQLNKLWRQRQKRIINTLKQENITQIEKHKRKMNVCTTQRQKCNSSSKFYF